MDDEEITQPTVEEFEAWYRPPDAVAAFGVDEDAAIREILARSRAGLLLAASGTASFTSARGSGGPNHYFRLIVKTRWWKMAAVDHSWDDFWQTGRMSLKFSDSYGRDSSGTLDLFDIRFDPATLRAAAPRPRAPTPPPPEKTVDTISPGKREVRPPVSEADLRKWFEFWRTTYPADMQTNDTALAHAQASFPKHGVTRERIRGIRDAKKPGPKPAAE